MRINHKWVFTILVMSAVAWASGTRTLDGAQITNGAATLTLPTTTDTLTGRTTTDTLTNKSLSGASNTFTAIPASAITGGAITSVTGDVTAAGPGAAAATVAKIRGTPVSATAPTSGQTLVYNSVSLQWEPQSFSAGANTSLSNLAATSINQSLIPDSDGARELGSASFRWADLYVNTIVNPGGINIFANGGDMNLTTAGDMNLNAQTGGAITLGSDGALNTLIQIYGTNGSGARHLRFFEDQANGFQYVALKAPNSLSGSTVFTLPSADGTSGQVLQTDGAGILSFVTSSGGSPGGASGAVQFNSSGSFGGNASNLFWNISSHWLGINTGSPRKALEVISNAPDAALFLNGQTSGDGGLAVEPSASGVNLQGTNGSLSAALAVSLNASGGNVGIGPVAPAYTLDIADTGGFPGGKFLNVVASTGAAFMDINSGGAITRLSAAVGVEGAVGTQSNHPFYVISNGTNRIFVSPSGDVGIGAAATGGPFEVHKDQNAQTLLTYSNNNGGSGANIAVLLSTANNSGFYAAYPNPYSAPVYSGRVVFGTNPDSGNTGIIIDAAKAGTDILFQVGASHTTRMSLTETELNLFKDLTFDTGTTANIRTANKPSGNTNVISMVTGDAASGNSGDMVLGTGTASGTRGIVAIDARAFLMVGAISGPAQVTPLRFYNTANTFYVGFQAANSFGANVDWTLPSTDGTSGQALVTDGAGILSWATSANTSLSNLTTTAINQSLLFDSDVTYDIGSNTAMVNALWLQTLETSQASQLVSFSTSDLTWSGDGITFEPATALTLKTHDTSGNSKAVSLKSGDSSAGNSGDVTIAPGTASGTRGAVVLQSHVKGAGSAPAVSSCGTGPSVAGNDTVGRVTVGTGVVTSCTLTFNQSWATAPVCVLNDETTTLLLKAAPTTTTVVISGTSLTGDTIGYHCIGY